MAEFKQALNVELPAVEQTMDGKINEILAVEVPRIEQKITEATKAEVVQLIDSVRLVFPAKAS